ncbi:MAG: zinc finger domain-containing protein, partial [Promethearchaeota archaeon]
MSSLIICPNCSGEGKIIVKKPTKCPTCRGMGSTKIIVGSKPKDKDKCLDCSGTGQIIEESETICPTCKGEGSKTN